MILKLRPIFAVSIALIIMGSILWFINKSIDAPVKTEKIHKTSIALKKPAADKNQAFFPTYRMQRERVRGQQLELLREIINNSNTDEKSRQSALERLLSLTSRMEIELKAEAVLKADGCKEAIVIMQNNDATVVISGIKDPRTDEIRQEMADFLSLESRQINVIVR